MREDFKVYDEMNRTGTPVFRVRTGGVKGHVVTSSYNKDDALELALQLNKDPWFFDRGNTRADRNKNG